ncbi:hypothetical protein ACHHRT_12655 [Desulfurivibrio sp. D14AmB]|uniref:hypothetical protein n=1 Tax=Desulfurivibrio sp. D14AmB TaxID=3374370 RepID=UPI00376F43B2
MTKRTTPLRSAPGTKKAPADLDAFAAAAGELPAGGAGEQEQYPWEHPRVRDDVMKAINLKMTEPLYLKLRYIADHTPYNMTSFIIERIGPEIEAEIERLTGKN